MADESALRTRREIRELASIYNEFASNRIGKDVHVVGRERLSQPKHRNWIHFAHLWYILRVYRGDRWEDRNVFIGAQFHYLPKAVALPYPNTLYGKVAWDKYEWYKQRRAKYVKNPKEVLNPKTGRDSNIADQFAQSAVFVQGRRRQGLPARDVYTLFKDTISPYFIVADPMARAHLAAKSNRYGEGVRQLFESLTRRPKLVRLLDRLWEKHVEAHH